jgi:polysaccharide biosynthesis protein PelC
MSMSPLPMKSFKFLLPLVLGSLAAGCSVMDRSSNAAVLESGAKWVILPVANHTETPQAGQRAEVLLESLLRQRGVQSVERPASLPAGDLVGDLPDRKVMQEAQRWATAQGYRYALTGAVDEWRYKVGVDGEPAVGVVLKVIDLSSGDVVWTAAGAKAGWSREALSAVGQKVIRDMLGQLTLR